MKLIRENRKKIKSEPVLFARYFFPDKKVPKYITEMMESISAPSVKRVALCTPRRFNLPIASSIGAIEELHRKYLGVPIKFVKDTKRNYTALLAHRKTHKIVRKYIHYWMVIGIEVEIIHAPWKELKNEK